MDRIASLAVAVAIGLFAAGNAQAAYLEVSPVIVELAAKQSTTTVTVANRSDAPTAVQLRVYRWSQAGDQDVMDPTDEVVVSPPIFTSMPGQIQTIRLLLRGGATSAERNYRMLINEVPPPVGPGRHVVMALRLSIPIFSPPTANRSEGPLGPALQWEARRDGPQDIILTARNTGPVYARLGVIAVGLTDGTQLRASPQGGNAYVLPGAVRHWLVKDAGSRVTSPLQLNLSGQSGKNDSKLIPLT